MRSDREGAEMTSMSDEPAAILVRAVREALSADDLESFSALLDPIVTWGPPGAEVPTCRNRSQVLAWFAAHRDGRSVELREVTARGNKLLVAMTVSTADGSEDRWQVLTVARNLVTDICGFDQEAAARAALTSPE